MRFAFLFPRWHPYSARARDLLFLLEELLERGHTCRVYAASWQGDTPAGVDLRKVPARGLFETRRRQAFVAGVQADLAGDPVDAVIGFEPCPGLDACFVSNPPLSKQPAAGPGRWLPGAGQPLAWERDLFSPGGSTHCLFTAPGFRDDYRQCYNTPDPHLHLLRPGVGPDRRVPEDAPRRRQGQRKALELESQDFTLLFIASDFAATGLDRVITALGHMQEQQPSMVTRLLVVGDGEARRYSRLAGKLGVGDRVDFLGTRDDVPDLLQAADLLVYPGREPARGLVLLEALVAGLPVVAMESSAYAPHVAEARAGILLPDPFSQEALDKAVMRYLDGVYRADSRESALLYGRLTDLYSLYSGVADLLEQLFAAKTVS